MDLFNLYGTIEVSFKVIGGLGALCLVAGVLSFALRIKATLALLKVTQWLTVFLMLAFTVLCWHASFSIANADSKVIGIELDRLGAFHQWWAWSGFAVGAIVYAIWLKMMLRSRQVVSAFTSVEGGAMAGDTTM